MDDPRLNGPNGNVNDDILDRVVRRAFRVERFATGEARWIRALLRRDLYPKLLERIAGRLAGISARGFDVGPQNSKRTANMFQSVDEIIREEILAAAREARKRMESLAKVESDWVIGAMEGAAPIELGLGPPDSFTLRSTVTARPFQGRLLKDWYSDLATDTQKRVRGAIRTGMAQSETIDQIVRRLRGTRAGGFRDGVLQTTTRQAEAIARTATAHVSAHAREASYEANSSLIKGIRWVSTLDSSTSLICIGLDGQVFPMGEGPRPPAHWRCRSSTTPVLKSWRDLGIDVDDITPGQRATMDGLVPADLTYGKWLKGQTAAFQDEVLGPRRGALFRDGLDLGKLVSKDLRPLTLVQLAALV